MDVVYILSPVRSGSTFLQFMLSRHPDVVGIGETSHVLKEYCQKNAPELPEACTCGEKPENCQFWGGLLEALPGLPVENGFEKILTKSNEVFPGKIIVDSSKSGVFLEKFYLNNIRSGNAMDINLKIIYLIRDFRGWVLSNAKHLKRGNRNNAWNTSIIINSYRWLYTSVKWLNKLKGYNIPFLQLYYENLVFDTDHQMQQIYQFLDLPPIGHSKGHVNSHELYGSISAKENIQNHLSIIYDTTWHTNLNFILAGPVILPVAIYNKKCADKTRNIKL